MFNKKINSLSFLTIAILSGCSSMHTPEYTKIKDNTEYLKGEKLDSFKKDFDYKREKIGAVNDGFYVDTDNFYLDDKKRTNLPLSFRENIYFNSKDKYYSANDFSAKFFDYTKIKTTFVDISKSKISQSNSKRDKTLNGDDENNSADSTGLILNGSSSDDEGGNQELLIKPFSFNGSVSEFLDYISIMNGLKWKYDEPSQQVFFYEKEMRVFHIYEKDLLVTTESKIESTSEAGGNEQNISYKRKENSWDSIEDNVTQLISEDGKVNFNREQGTILVQDNDFVLSKVKDYVDTMNSDMTREVVVELNVMTLKLDNSSNLELSMNYLNENLESSLLGDFTGNLGLGLLENSGNVGNGFRAGLSNNSGYSALFGMLSTFGDVSFESKNSFKTLNNKILSLQISTNTDYVKEMSLSYDSQTARETFDYDVQTIKEGMTLNLSPRIIGNEVISDYSISILDDDGFAPSPVDSLQLPKTSNKDISQISVSKNGQTNVLFVYEKDKAESITNAPFIESLWPLGGKENFEKSREIIVISTTTYFDVK